MVSSCLRVSYYNRCYLSLCVRREAMRGRALEIWKSKSFNKSHSPESHTEKGLWEDGRAGMRLPISTITLSESVPCNYFGIIVLLKPFYFQGKSFMANCSLFQSNSALWEAAAIHHRGNTAHGRQPSMSF